MRVTGLCAVVLFSICVFAITPEDEIMQLDRQFNHKFNQATLENRADAWMSYFADNAVVPATPPLAGKQALTEHYKKVFADADFSLTWDPMKAEVFPGDKMGYSVGKYLARFKEKDGKQMEQSGRYITIWKKQGDGSWKIVADTGSDDGPARPAR